MSGENFEFLALGMRYFFSALMVLIVFYAVRGALIDSRRSAKLRRLLPQTGVSGELVVTSGGQKAKTGMKYTLIREGLIGSSKRSDIRVRHGSIRRRHAYFQLTEQGLRLRSHAGARLVGSDHRIARESIVRDGQRFTLGDVELMLVLHLQDSFTPPHGRAEAFDDEMFDVGGWDDESYDWDDSWDVRDSHQMRRRIHSRRNQRGDFFGLGFGDGSGDDDFSDHDGSDLMDGFDFLNSDRAERTRRAGADCSAHDYRDAGSGRSRNNPSGRAASESDDDLGVWLDDSDANGGPSRRRPDPARRAAKPGQPRTDADPFDVSGMNEGPFDIGGASAGMGAANASARSGEKASPNARAAERSSDESGARTSGHRAAEVKTSGYRSAEAEMITSGYPAAEVEAKASGYRAAETSPRRAPRQPFASPIRPVRTEPVSEADPCDSLFAAAQARAAKEAEVYTDESGAKASGHRAAETSARRAPRQPFASPIRPVRTEGFSEVFRAEADRENSGETFTGVDPYDDPFSVTVSSAGDSPFARPRDSGRHASGEFSGAGSRAPRHAVPQPEDDWDDAEDDFDPDIPVRGIPDDSDPDALFRTNFDDDQF